MRIPLILASLFLAVISGLLGFMFFKETTFEDALDAFEAQNYVKAITVLNTLIPRSDYESGEKMYYYRARSINELADQLEEDYADELAEASLEKKGGPSFEEAQRYIQEELDDINRDIDGDLTLALTRDTSRITSQGAFYHEFIMKYKGSSYIEDLDYMEVKKQIKTHPDDTARELINFYQRYPNTAYIADIATLIFEQIRTTPEVVKNNSALLMDLFINYGKKFPSSPEIKKLYTVNGSSVNLRNSPGTDSTVVAKTHEKDIVIEQEKSMDTMQIGDTRAYWYRIVTLSGESGWLFGKFLNRLDVTEMTTRKRATWSFNEDFDSWQDSHTPSRWNHINDTGKSSIGFYNTGTNKIARLKNSTAPAGIFNRYSTAREFILQVRARHCGGCPVVIAHVLPDGKTHSLRLCGESLKISGRKIPLHTSDWHTYTLESMDGKYASLLIDGEVISGRIEPVRIPHFTHRGIYSMYSQGKAPSCCEVDYIRVR